MPFLPSPEYRNHLRNQAACGICRIAGNFFLRLNYVPRGGVAPVIPAVMTSVSYTTLTSMSPSLTRQLPMTDVVELRKVALKHV